MTTHTVQPGDNISTIAAHYGVDWRELAAANGIPITKKNGRDFALIRPGQNLDVPPGGSKTVAGKEPTPPLPTPKPKPVEKPKEQGTPVFYQSEWDQMVKNDPKNVPQDKILIPDPPKPQIKTEPPAPDHPNSDQFPPSVEGEHTPWWKQALDDADPVKVLSQVSRPGGSADPDWTDRLNVAALAAGPEGEEAAALLERPLAGEARLAADNSVSRGTTPRSLLDNRFTRMNPGSMGETPIRGEPRLGRGPRSPITVDPVTGRFRPGRSLEVPPDQGSMGIDSPFMRREPIADPEHMSVIGEPGFEAYPGADDEVLAHYGRASGGRLVGYAMGGSPFELNDPGLPVEDVGDVVPFRRQSIEPGMGTEGARTYMGGSNARVGTPEWNSQYEAKTGLRPGSLVPSNAGRGDVVNMPSQMTNDELSSKIHSVDPMSEADHANLKKWMNDPKLQDKFAHAYSQLTPEERTRYVQWLGQNYESYEPTKARGGRTGYAIGGNPQAFVERAASYGLRHEGFLNSGVPGRTDHIGLKVRNGSYVIPADIVSAAGQGNSIAGAKAFGSLLKQGPYGTSPMGIKPPRMQMPMGGSMKSSMSMTKMAGPKGGGSMRMSGIPNIATGGNVTDMPKNTTDVPKNVPPPRNTWGNGPWQHPEQAASGGQIKKPRELVVPKANWNGASEGGARTAGPDHHIPILAAGGEYIVSPETVARIGGGDAQKGFRILDQLVLKTRKKHIHTLKNLKPPKKK